MADNRANVIISAQDRASEVLRRLSGTVDGMQRSFEGISAPLLRFQTLWASLIGGAVVGGIRALVSTIDDLDEAAQSLGTTAVELSNLRQAAREAGVGAETFDTALTKLNINLSEAAAGSKQQVALFNALGISIKDVAGNVRPATEIVAQLANAFARMEDGPAKAALAVDLFGKAGARLIPLLNQGSGSLDRFSGLTQATVDAANKLQAETDKLSASWERFKFTLAAGVIPAINKTIEALTGLGTEEQRIAELRTIIRSMEQSQTGDPRNYERYKRELEALEQRQRAIAEGAKVSGAEATQAKLSAQAVRDKAAADLAGADAAGKKARATEESSNAYAKEFADFARIRANNLRRSQELEDEANRERDRRQSRLEDLTGRTAARQQMEDMKALDDAFFAAAISVEEYDVGLRKVFGTNSDITKGMERQGELAEQLGLEMASSLGELITSGGRAGDVWKALGQDVLKLVTQMLILKPLAKELADIFSGLGSQGGGGSGSSFFGSLLRGIGGAVMGGGGGGQNADGSWGYVDAGRAVTTNVYIDGAVDRARIASYVESGVKAGLAASWDNVARGGTGVLVG